MRIAQVWAVDPDGVTLMAEATEEGLDERFVSQKGLPFGVVEVECRVNCYAESRLARPRGSVIVKRSHSA